MAITGATGSPPPETLKVALNDVGRYRNTMTMVLTGLDVESKAAFAQRQLFDILGGRDSFAEPDVRLLRLDTPDAPTNDQACDHLRITVKDTDPRKRPGVLERDHGDRFGRVRGLSHHHATHVGIGVRRVPPGGRAPVERDAGRGTARR